VKSVRIKIEAELKPWPFHKPIGRTGRSTLIEKDYTAKDIQAAWDAGHKFDFRDGIDDWFKKNPYWDGASTYKGDWNNKYVRIWYNKNTQSIILSGDRCCPTCGHIDRTESSGEYEY
jgi:hypothetical protein